MMGTGGANRIRTAIVQTVNLLLDHQMSAKEAIDFPRIHFEGGTLNAETFAGPTFELETLGPKNLWPLKNPIFSLVACIW